MNILTEEADVVNDFLPISREEVEEELLMLIGQGGINPYFYGMMRGYNQEETIIGLIYWYDKGVQIGIELRENPTNIRQLWRSEINKLTFITGT